MNIKNDNQNSMFWLIIALYTLFEINILAYNIMIFETKFGKPNQLELYVHEKNDNGEIYVIIIS